MKKPMTCLALLACAVSFAAAADPWKDESGHGRHGHGQYKQEYWDGNCKVERKWKGNGDYKEERKCRPARYGYPAVRVYPAYPLPGISIEPGIVIHGTAVIR